VKPVQASKDQIDAPSASAALAGKSDKNVKSGSNVKPPRFGKFTNLFKGQKLKATEPKSAGVQESVSRSSPQILTKNSRRDSTDHNVPVNKNTFAMGTTTTTTTNGVSVAVTQNRLYA